MAGLVDDRITGAHAESVCAGTIFAMTLDPSIRTRTTVAGLTTSIGLKTLDLISQPHGREVVYSEESKGLRLDGVSPCEKVSVSFTLLMDFQTLLFPVIIPNLSQSGLRLSAIRIASFFLATKHRKDMRRLWPLLTHGWGRRRLRDSSLKSIQLESTGFIRNRVPSPSESPSRLKSHWNAVFVLR